MQQTLIKEMACTGGEIYMVLKDAFDRMLLRVVRGLSASVALTEMPMEQMHVPDATVFLSSLVFNASWSPCCNRDIKRLCPCAYANS